MREFKETEKVESENSFLQDKLERIEDNRTFDEVRNLKISDLLSEIKDRLNPRETTKVEDANLINILDNFTQEKFEDFSQTNKNFENKEKRINDRLLKADSLAGEEKESFIKGTLDEIRKYKGATLEMLVKDNLEDKFIKVEDTQRNIETLGGNTKPDIVARGAQTDFKIGEVPIKAGQDVYIECKIGESSYLSNQFSDKHIYKQLQGHHVDGKETSQDHKSILAVSSDFLDLSKEKQEEYSKNVFDLGSELVVLECSAQEMDKVMLEKFLGGE